MRSVSGSSPASSTAQAHQDLDVLLSAPINIEIKQLDALCLRQLPCIKHSPGTTCLMLATNQDMYCTSLAAAGKV